MPDFQHASATSGTPSRHGRQASLYRDDVAQDLVEYALLTALVAMITVAAWALIEQRLGTSYQTFDGQTQAIWEPPDPI